MVVAVIMMDLVGGVGWNVIYMIIGVRIVIGGVDVARSVYQDVNKINISHIMKMMSEKLVGKGFFLMSLSVVGYFCLLYLNAYVIKADFVLIGFFQEILTFPFLILVQPTLLVLSFVSFVENKFRIKTYSFWSFLILLVSNVFFLGDFILSKIP